MPDKDPHHPAPAGSPAHETPRPVQAARRPGFDPKAIKGLKGGKPAHQTTRHTQAPIKPRGR